MVAVKIVCVRRLPTMTFIATRGAGPLQRRARS
jgi:hypothetical protein